MSSALEIKHLSKTFLKGTPDEKLALSDVSLSVAPGDFITILGWNRAGKTTLFNAILGVFACDAGTILLDGDDITYKPRHKRAYNIGCLYQNPLRSTAPNMTIEENLALAYGRHSSRSFFAVNRRDTEYFREILSELDMGLEDRMKTKMGQLSGGQRQAASLLMATISKPKLLLLDEHTAALDPSSVEKVMALTTKTVEREKVTTMMITHNMSDALKFGTRTVMMDAGKIVFDVKGEARASLTPDDLVRSFREKSKNALSDRTLLSE